jgi:hypothetical protein
VKQRIENTGFLSELVWNTNNIGKYWFVVSIVV